MRLRSVLHLSCIGLAFAANLAQAATPHPLSLDDMAKLQAVSDPVCSPDGQWVAYSVAQTDVEADKRRTALWLTNWAGTEDFRLTSASESSSQPAFSPDGKQIAFLSARGGDGPEQIYLLDRRGGEAQALTEVTGDIAAFAWSPDGKQMVIEMTPAADDNPGEKKDKADKRPKPVVLSDYHFKQDEIGYQSAHDHARLFLFDLASKSLSPLTVTEHFDDAHATWSPDGKLIAFVTDHSGDRDDPGIHVLSVIEPHAGAVAKRLAKFDAPEQQTLLWSQDGKRIIHSIGFEAKYGAYSQDRLAATELASGATSLLTAKFDRGVAKPLHLADKGSVLALVSDDRHHYPATVTLANGAVKALPTDGMTIDSYCSGSGHLAVMATSDLAPPELYALDGGKLRALTSRNKAVMEQIALGAVDDISFPSSDGAEIHGLMIKPPDYQPGQLYPTVVWIHGGPNGQDAHGLEVGSGEMVRQWFAAHGYVVLAVNYRGSSGRGAEFARSIVADWGNKEVKDVLAAVDYAVAAKITDPNRLGIGGWSYGGITTDYVIASDTRFKAAISGAGAGNWFSLYGVDQYVLQYNEELGMPWRNPELYLKLSYPFLHADRITTPTLFLGGTKDANVPLVGGEQMFEALQTLKIDSELVAYPDEYHGLRRPSFVRDRLERMVGWYDRYLSGK